MRRFTFATWLEGALNQIQLQCPRRMMAVEVHQHLKDHLFHGVHKLIHDSVQYLYSGHGTSYLQLMVAARKVESKNEETPEKVTAGATVTSNPWEGMAEPSQQIAKLMAVITQTGQGSRPPVPQEHGHGWGHDGRSTPSHLNSQHGRGNPGQPAPAHSLLMEWGWRLQEAGLVIRTTMCPMQGEGCSWTPRPTLLPVF